MSTTDDIRTRFEARGGRLRLSTLLEAVAAEAMQAAARAARDMEARGELVYEGAGVYRLVAEVKLGGKPSEAHAIMWRAAHQLCVRTGTFAPVELENLSGVTKRNVHYWLKEMVGAGHLIKRAHARYSLAKDAPHRDEPPYFRWPRRGKAKTRKDKK